jgi:hypothetical protein
LPSTTDEFIVGYNGDLPIYSFYSASCSLVVEVAPEASGTDSTGSDGDGCQLHRR